MRKNEISDELQKKLDEFDVTMPDFQVKRSKIDRFVNWIYAPAKNPLDVVKIKGNSITRVVLYPLIIILILFFTPIFLI